MHQIKLIDDQHNMQQSNIQFTRRFPSPTNTELVSSPEDEDNNGADMYVDEAQ